MPDLRSDQAILHVTVAGSSLDKEPWTSMEGGDIAVTPVKTRGGGVGDETNIGGPRTRSDCTVARQYTNDILHPLKVQLEGLAGSAAMKVSWTPVDADGNPNGDTHTIQGKLDDVTTTKRDRNAPEAMFLTLVMGCDATPTVIS